MALNIPMPDLPGNALLKGLTTGSNILHNMMLNKYYGTLHPSGDVANAIYIEDLVNRYGPDDPRVLQARKAFEMGLNAKQSLIDYRDVLNQTAGIRNSSPLGKLLAEGRGEGAIDILKGNKKDANAPPGARYKEGEQYYNAEGDPVYPTGNNPTGNTSTGHSPEINQAYEQAIGKQTTDPAIRNKIPYAENVKITMQNINPDDLVQYSGPKGHIKLGIETLKAAFGNPSEEFMRYQTALTGAQTLKKQLRQFWGDSIQPAATEAIGKLTNPSTWINNPQIAKQQFNQLLKITDQELESFTKHGTSPVKLNFDPKTGSFFAGESKGEAPTKSALQQKIETENNKAKPTAVIPALSKEDDQVIDENLAELQGINPKYTKENIISTAKKRGLTVGQVIDQLYSKGG